MQKMASLIFCAVSFALVIGLMWILFPHMARSTQEVQASNTAMGAELFDDVDLADFGQVPVLDMMQFYIESPPVDSGKASTKVRFQGC